MKEIKQLNKWTNKKCSEVLFDSDKDDWNQNTSVFDDRVKGKNNLMFVVEYTNNNKFGYYLSSSVNQSLNNWTSDSNAFLFSLKSNGRVNGMYKFEINPNQSTNACHLYDKSNSHLIGLGYYSIIRLLL